MIVAALFLVVQAQAAPSDTTGSAPAKPQKVCRTTEGNGGLGIGTIMPPSKVCRTPAQWAKIDAKHSKGAKAG